MLYNEKVIYFGFVNSCMDIRKRMTTFLKKALDTTYITKKDFETTFKDIRGKGVAKGIMFKNKKQNIFVFPSKKTLIWEKEGKRTIHRFNRFIISCGRRDKLHLMIETSPEVFTFLIKSKSVTKRRPLKNKGSVKTVIRERYYIPVNKKILSESSTIEVKLPENEITDIHAQFRTLFMKQRNPFLKKHLEKSLKNYEVNEVLRMGFTIQDIMLFLPALNLSTQKKQKIIDQIFNKILWSSR